MAYGKAPRHLIYDSEDRRRKRRRKRTDAKIARAHELALEEWPDEHLDRISPPVRGNPWIRPLAPTPEDRAFAAARREILQRLEVQPTGHHSVTEDGPRVVAGWEAVDTDD